MDTCKHQHIKIINSVNQKGLISRKGLICKDCGLILKKKILKEG